MAKRVITQKRKAYLREYQRNWMSKRRQAFFHDKSCIKCGSTDKLELDHRDPKKKVSHAIWSWSKRRRLDEIAKCQVLCRDCHWAKTKLDMGYKLKHGTETGYRNYRCRCRPCKDAHYDKIKRYRAGVRMRALKLSIKAVTP